MIWIWLIACNPGQSIDTPRGHELGDGTIAVPAAPTMSTQHQPWTWPTKTSTSPAAPDGELIVQSCGGSTGFGQNNQRLHRPEVRSAPKKSRRPSAKPTAGSPNVGGLKNAPAPERTTRSGGAADAPVALPPEGFLGGGEKEAQRRAPPTDAESNKQQPTLKKDKFDGAAQEQAPVDLIVVKSEDADREEEMMPVERKSKPSAPVLDWGATVHISNDDSMSLASAQRVLFNAMNGRSSQLSQIRPHELLNYFSFDTTKVANDQTFSVQGSAEQQGDILSVALAVQGALPERQPLDLTWVIDKSGSMNAEGRMDYTKRALRLMKDQLQPGDRLDVVYFSSGVCTPVQNFVVGRDDPQVVINAIDSLRPGGGTNLEAGLREAYQIQTSREKANVHGRNRRVMLFTDAMLNTGIVNENVVSEVGKGFESNDIRLTGVGVGKQFNDDLLDKLTEKGKGAYVYLGSESVVDRLFGRIGFSSLTQTLAHNVRFSLDLPDSLAMERFYGEEASTNAEDIQPINYYAGTSQVFLQDLKIKGGALHSSDSLVMNIEWRDAQTGEPHKASMRTTLGALVDGDRHNLHKAQALMAWTDFLMADAMGGSACHEPLSAYASKVASLKDDAEIGFVTGLVEKRCHLSSGISSAQTVSFKVKVDSDQPIGEVRLNCGSGHQRQALSGSSNIATFQSMSGRCTVQLQGTIPLRAQIEVPQTGGSIRCVVRGGRLSCN